MKKLISLLTLISLSAFGQTQMTFEDIQTSGTGCAPGTVSSTISPDGASLSLIFDEFRVQVPNYETTPAPAPETGRGPSYRPPRTTSSVLESSKTCNITFVTTLPAGQTATGIEISLQARGNTAIDQGINSYFSTILVGHRGLANSVGPQLKVIENKLWNARREAMTDDWTTDKKVLVPLQAACASATEKKIKFELKNHLEAKITTNDPTKSGILTVDSNDSKGLLTFTLKSAPCGSKLAPR